MHFDTSAVMADRPRKAIENVLAELDLLPQERNAWAHDHSAGDLLVIGDLSEVVKEECWESLRSLRSKSSGGKMLIMLVVRTKDDEAALADPDLSVRMKGGSLFLFEMKQFDARPQEKLQSAFGAYVRTMLSRLTPENVSSVQFVGADDMLVVEFGDGYRRVLKWNELPYANRVPKLLPSSASVSEHCDSITFLDEQGEEYDVDGASLRALTSKVHRARLDAQASSVAANVGTRLKEIRAARSITQDELSRTSGIAQPSLSRIEGGVRAPRMETLEKYATGLGMRLGDLLAELRVK